MPGEKPLVPFTVPQVYSENFFGRGSETGCGGIFLRQDCQRFSTEAEKEDFPCQGAQGKIIFRNRKEGKFVGEKFVYGVRVFAAVLDRDTTLRALKTGYEYHEFVVKFLPCPCDQVWFVKSKRAAQKLKKAFCKADLKCEIVKMDSSDEIFKDIRKKEQT